MISVCLLLATLASGAHAAAERFVIDAQYRGLVSRSFPGIGFATVDSVVTAPGVMHLTASGQATHPQDAAKTYRTAVDLKLSVSGNRFAVLSTSHRSAAGSERFASQIQQVMPILAMVCTLPDLTRVRTLESSSGAIQIGCRNTAPGVEVTAQRGSQFVGKFFLSRQGAGLRLDRFRVPSPEAGVMLNFVAARTGQPSATVD